MGRGSSGSKSAKSVSVSSGAVSTADIKIQAQKITAYEAEKLSDSDLNLLIEKLEQKISRVKDKLSDIASKNKPHEMPKEFYDTKKEQQNLEGNLRIILKEKGKRKTVVTEAKRSTFVNSFGEATKRYITTTQYEKKRKSMSRKIMRYIGG